MLPGGICSVHRAGHLVCGKTQGFEHIALPDAGQPQVFQHEDGALALLVQLAEPADEGSQGAHGVVLPRRRKFFGGHTRDTGELREVVPTLCNGLFNGVERLGHSGTARLGFDADRGHRRRQSHDLRLGQSGQLTRRRQARTHRHDLGFRRGEVIAKVNDDRAEPSVIVRCHAGNVGEARKGGCCLVSCHVGGSAEHGHDLGEVQQGVLLDAELSRGFGYRCNLLCGGGDLRGQRLDGVRHRCQLRIRKISGLGDPGDGTLKVHGCLRTIGKVFIDFLQRSSDASGHDGLMDRIECGFCSYAKGICFFCSSLFLFLESVNFSSKLFRAVSEVIGVDARLL